MKRFESGGAGTRGGGGIVLDPRDRDVGEEGALLGLVEAAGLERPGQSGLDGGQVTLFVGELDGEDARAARRQPQGLAERQRRRREAGHGGARGGDLIDLADRARA